MLCTIKTVNHTSIPDCNRFALLTLSFWKWAKCKVNNKIVINVQRKLYTDKVSLIKMICICFCVSSVSSACHYNSDLQVVVQTSKMHNHLHPHTLLHKYLGAVCTLLTLLEGTSHILLPRNQCYIRPSGFSWTGLCHSAQRWIRLYTQ